MKSKIWSELLGSLVGFIGISLTLVVLQPFVEAGTTMEPSISGFGFAYTLIIIGLLVAGMLTLLLLRFRVNVRIGARELAAKIKNSSDIFLIPRSFAKLLPFAWTYVAIVAAYIAVGIIVNAFGSLMDTLISGSPERYPWLSKFVQVLPIGSWVLLVLALAFQVVHSTQGLRRDINALGPNWSSDDKLDGPSNSENSLYKNSFASHSRSYFDMHPIQRMPHEHKVSDQVTLDSES